MLIVTSVYKLRDFDYLLPRPPYPFTINSNSDSDVFYPKLLFYHYFSLSLHQFYEHTDHRCLDLCPYCVHVPSPVSRYWFPVGHLKLKNHPVLEGTETGTRLALGIVTGEKHIQAGKIVCAYDSVGICLLATRTGGARPAECHREPVQGLVWASCLAWAALLGEVCPEAPGLSPSPVTALPSKSSPPSLSPCTSVCLSSGTLTGLRTQLNIVNILSRIPVRAEF